MTGLSASGLRELLRSAFRARLEPAGWEILDAQDNRHSLASFRLGLDEEFAATAEVWMASSLPDRPPVVLTRLFVGVSYEPLRGLSPLLDLYPVSVLHEDVWPEFSEDSEEDNQEDDEDRLEVNTADDAGRAVDRLAPVILERAVAFAEPYASLDALLAEFSRDQFTCAALLASCRRFDEARESLSHLPPQSDMSRRRAARQLKRWIDRDGDPALLPSSPRPSRHEGHERPSVSDAWATGRAQNAAVKEVKAAAKGKSREEARAMLHDALARRGVQEKSPMWVENTLDHLWDTPADQLQLGLNLLKGATRFGVGVAKAIRDRQLPDLSTPDWLEPPDHALYEVPRSNEWIAAELDPDAGPWLDRVHEATPHPLGIAQLTAWLRRVDGDICDAREIEVYLGEGRVGRIPAQDAGTYAAVLDDAAFRDEHPCLDARLAQRERPPRYVLELTKPL